MPTESVSVTLGDKPCLDVFTALDECNRLGIPVDSWLGRANSFTCPLGPAPGRGYVLMLKRDLDELDKESFLDLKFAAGDSSQTISSVVFVKAIAITPAIEDDGNAAFLVELADKRHLAEMTWIDSQYNVLTPNPAADHFEWSLDGGTDVWDWQGIIDDIWLQLPVLGDDSPSLPSSPPSDFTGFDPNNFRFCGVSAWDALNAVLAAIGCAVQWNPFDATASIVSLGATSDIEDKAAANKSKLLWDSRTIAGRMGRLPGKCRVFFNAQDYRIGTDATVLTANDQWEGTPAYSKEIEFAEDDNAGAADSIQVLWGDMVATYDGNATTPTNQSDLDARAEEMANDYLRSQDDAGEFLHRVYSGVLDFRPDARITAVRWRACAARGILSGLTTEVLRLPGGIMEDMDNWPKLGQWPEVRDNRMPPDLARGRFPSFRVICFELTASLSSGGSAAAKIKKYNGTSWVDSGATTTVYDFVGTGSTVASGKKGLAFLFNQAGAAGVQSGRYIVFAYEC